MLLQIAVALSTLLVLAESSAQVGELVGCVRRNNMYMNGIEMGGINDQSLNRFQRAICRPGSARWSNERQQVVVENWWVTFDTMGWALCPEGHFLIGIRRVTERTFKLIELIAYFITPSPGAAYNKVLFKKEDQLLHHIEEGVCAKPADHPHHYKHNHCEKLDITKCYTKTGPCECKQGYYLAGLYREECDRAVCLTGFRCCSMVDEMDKLDGIDSVQTLIMDRTLYPLSNLAFDLGYGWCLGCRGDYIGDDFKTNGYTWEAVLSEFCEGYKHEERLKIDYLDWSYEKTNEKFGEMKTEVMQVVTVDRKINRNYSNKPQTSVLTRAYTDTQTLTHTTTNSWRKSHELGIEISVPFEHIAPKLNYKFSYENSQMVVDGTNNSSSSTFTTSETVTVPAESEVEWKLKLHKILVSIPYTVTVRAKFSTQFRGFLRWGGGKNSKTTNYHYAHRGSGDRPTVNYRFGDRHIPFYHALKQQSDRNAKPWLWVDLKKAYTSSQSMINQLTDEKNYEFTLTGWFTHIHGTKIEIEVSAPKKISRIRRSMNRTEIMTETDMSVINKTKNGMVNISNVKTDMEDMNKMKNGMPDMKKIKNGMPDMNKMKNGMPDMNKMKNGMPDMIKMKNDAEGTAMILDLLKTPISAHASQLPYLEFIDLKEKMDPGDM